MGEDRAQGHAARGGVRVVRPAMARATPAPSLRQPGEAWQT